ncbi:MAG: hypothetical protein COC17_08065 [Hyphomicrobiales bacterium]|nr:DUF3429 domain-containing protein [Hyphomicrobiales bacterium]PCH49579.1 MAG: hypothetical protein COC17_08065 [Hyphomicrobiales bacterium]
MENQPADKNKQMAWILSILGLVPFVLIAVTILFLDSSNAAIDPIFSIFRTYSALMLTFLGGIRWGYIMREDNEFVETKALIISVLPALLAWMALLAPQEFAPITLLVFLLAFCAHGAWDSFAGNSERLPVWYSNLRVKITLAVAACHIVVFIVVGN